jgi:Cu/Ag efflux protein CusF
MILSYLNMKKIACIVFMVAVAASCSKSPVPNLQPLDSVTVPSVPTKTMIGKSLDSTKTKKTNIEKTYRVLAQITEIDEKNNSITIDHEKIEGYMGAMEMPYPVGDHSIFKKVKVGTKGHFIIKVTNGVAIITGVHVHEE